MAETPGTIVADPSGTVLRDVSVSLRSLIETQLFSGMQGGIQVEHHSPSAEEVVLQGRRPLLLVFPYRVSDNPYLANAPPTILRTGNGFVRRPAPVAVDVLYLFIPYAQVPDMDILIINGLKRLFADFSVLDGDLLKGVLKETGNERLAIVPENLTLDQMHHIWAGFPNKPFRLSLCYTVTPVRIPRATRERAERILNVSTTYSPRGEEAEKLMPFAPESILARISAAVLVVDAQSKAILTSVQFCFVASAAQWRPHITPDGYHVFTDIPEGRYTVSIESLEYTRQEATIDVPKVSTLSNMMTRIELTRRSA